MNIHPFKPAAMALAVSATILGSFASAYAAEDGSDNRVPKESRKKPAASTRAEGMDLRMPRSRALEMPGVSGAAPTIIAAGPGVRIDSIDEDIRRLHQRIEIQEKLLASRQDTNPDLRMITEHLEMQRQILSKFERRLSEMEQRGTGYAAERPMVSGITVAPGSGGRLTANPVPDAAAARNEVESRLAAEPAREVSPYSIDVGFSYARTDRRQLALNGFLALDAIFLGNISVDNIKSDVMTADVGLRYRLNTRWQYDVQMPLVYRSTVYQSGGGNNSAAQVAEASVSNIDVGDISAGFSYQAFSEQGSRPDIYFNARIKGPTGSHPYGVKLRKVPGSGDNLTVPDTLPSGNGLWGATVGVSAVKTLSPATLFGSFAYNYNHARHFDDISSAPGTTVPGSVKLGDSIGWSVGSAFALNERFSLSTSFSQKLQAQSKTRLDGGTWENIVGSEGNAGTLSLGAAYALSGTEAISGSVGVGLTPDAPNFTVGLRFSRSL
jgi:hypothetical protein